ncbi:MAG: hypothetical protein ACI9XU_000274 [Arenicella sp.]|jgi:uncharacterized protein (DUF885 family)
MPLLLRKTLMLFKKTHLLLVFSALLTITACGDQSNTSVEHSKSATADVSEETAAVSEIQKAKDLFERAFEESIARSPEAQTFLGRSTNRDKWDDLSEEFDQESLRLSKVYLAELVAIDVSQLDAPTKLSYDLFKQSLEEDIADFKWRLYNYPVNQMFGTHSGVPSLLINQHGISNIEDAETYIARLNNLPVYFDQLIVGLKARAAAGIIPPQFVFPHIIRDSKNLITGAPFDEGDANPIMSDFADKMDKLEANVDAGLTPENKAALMESAKQALLDSYKPAYQSLVTYLTDLQTLATTDDGIWKWKDGAEYYDVALARTTTTDLTSEQIHQIGLDEVKRIHDEMREIKDKVGFDGDLSAFMQFMRDDPQFYYPGTEEGRARYLSEATQLIETMKGSLDEMFITKPVADINVKAVEAFREQSAGKAFYQRPSEDGTRPGLYYANLFDMQAMPTYQMEALAYHEGIPGHHMQLAIQQELKDIPKFRKFGGYTAYTEGWGLYSEMLPKDFGYYTDPYSDFGRLAMELWRACRLVVDTGIHSKKWTREQGIAYYTDNTPNAVSDGVKMVERHIVMPSQATAYKIGMLKIWKLREDSKKVLGDKFDIREFHDEIIKYGPLPLNVMESKVDAWVAAKLAS